MKNWKHCTLIVFMALLVFTFIGCGDDEETICKCTEKNHLGIDQGKCADICDCTEWSDTLNGTAIEIRKQVGVTNAQANAAVTKINAAYGLRNGGQKAIFAAKVTEIHVIAGNTTNFVGGIWYVGHGVDAEDLKDLILDDIILSN